MNQTVLVHYGVLGMKWGIRKDKDAGHNPNSPTHVQKIGIYTKPMIHLSSENLEGRVLTPRVPDNFLVRNGYENSSTKRVSFTPDIDSSLMAMSQNLRGKKLYVYGPDDQQKYTVYKPNEIAVPDSKLTNELWIQEPVRLKLLGGITVGEAKNNPQKYSYGSNSAELFPWEYSLNSSELKHFGVLGMKWGVRKDQNVNKDISEIIGSLGKNEFKDFDVKKAFYKKVYYNDTRPSGFALMERHNENGRKVVDISIAVRPEDRGRRLAQKMAEDAINAARTDFQIEKIYWGFEKGNIGSEKLAKNLNFEFDYSEDGYDIYSIEMNMKHFGILGMKWGIRRYQNEDGTLTPRGLARRDKVDDKWARTKGEKVRKKIQKTVKKDINKFAKNELSVAYTSRGRLSSNTILQYNNQLARLMNEKVPDVRAPSGRVLRFVAKRGELGVHTAVADEGYNMDQLRRGVFGSGKVAYKSENLMKGGG